MTNSNPDIPDFNPTQTFRQTMYIEQNISWQIELRNRWNKTMDNSKVTQ